MPGRGAQGRAAGGGCGRVRRRRSKRGFTLRTHYNVVPGYISGSEEHKYSELVAKQAANLDRQPRAALYPDCHRRLGQAALGGSRWAWSRTWMGCIPIARRPAGWCAWTLPGTGWTSTPNRPPPSGLLLVYAWNELGEGGFIAPTKGDPEGAYLKAVRSVVLPQKKQE